MNTDDKKRAMLDFGDLPAVAPSAVDMQVVKVDARGRVQGDASNP